MRGTIASSIASCLEWLARGGLSLSPYIPSQLSTQGKMRECNRGQIYPKVGRKNRVSRFEGKVLFSKLGEK